MILALVFGFFGAVIGWTMADVPGAVVGVALGGLAGWMAARSGRQASRSLPQYGVRAPAPPAGAAVTPASGDPRLDAVLMRLAAVEHRLASLEQGVSQRKASAAEWPEESVVAARPLPVRADTAEASAQPPTALASVAAVAPAPAATTPTAPVPSPASRVPSAPNLLWAWFASGITLTRLGVVVLFFGVAFLLRWFAERFTVPIEIRLLGVAAAGVALVAAGLHIARSRAAYGLALQGAGGGILYLTAFAALRLHEVLAAEGAFALLVVVSAGTVWLALRADSQALAALAIAGGFLAPVLVAPGGGEPLPLFGYLALLNGAVFALAWRKAWRGLNAQGFVFTFALALVWGYQYYAPRHLAVVEPFLVLFFAFYVVIAILDAVRGGVTLSRPVDALLVFGVPVAAFALQHGLVRDFRYGEAWSAAALALIYGILFLALRRRAEPGLALLSRAFAVLSVAFATLAIPFAVDATHTAAWWALEAAGAWWLGCRQRQVAVRAFALLLQFGAALAFVHAGVPDGERALFANAAFMGAALIGIAAFATGFVADRDVTVLEGGERTLLPWVFAWGMLWWVGAGYVELTDQLPPRQQAHALLAWVLGSTALALVLARVLRWPRLARFGFALLPTMAAVAAHDVDRHHTTLATYGTWLFPLAWLAQWAMLRALDRTPPGDARTSTSGDGMLSRLHVVSIILLVVWLSWEAGEWTGRATTEGTAWITCATALPGIVFLLGIVAVGEGRAWPLGRHREAYAVTAGMVVAALLAAWFALANALSPGNPDPLPYVPLANPLDLTLAAALAALTLWSSPNARVRDRQRFTFLGLALFIALNGLVVRTAHHWAELPWRLPDLLASKPLQAALTLTWTATALPLMFLATRRVLRPLWMVGAALLALVVAKLFLLDLAALSGLPRVVAFLGVGALLLVIGYVAPLPPASRAGDVQAPGLVSDETAAKTLESGSTTP